MQTLTVKRTIWINAPRERVWQAITDANQIMKWWGGGDHWEIDELKVGGTIKFGDPADLMLATIAVLDPPREFRLRWPPQEQYHNLEMFTTYVLETENGGTRVTVSETGFEGLPADVRQKRYESTMSGYESVLAGLKKYIEEGA
ncbi:MAG: SRPBCC domain-containing protein [Chloroflexi bacterium]|nr:SRPBCC domain-containing protein [Chloroflexota bacterium]